MGNRKWWTVFMIALTVFVSPVLAFGDESLRGLQGVNVVIELDKCEGTRLTEDQLQTDVELKLRMAGIKVLTEAESLKTPGNPTLVVNVNCYKLQLHNIYCLCLQIRVLQSAYLTRNPSIFSRSATWEDAILGWTVASRLSRYGRDAVIESMDRFIDAYLSVNPKK